MKRSTDIEESMTRVTLNYTGEAWRGILVVRVWQDEPTARDKWDHEMVDLKVRSAWSKLNAVPQTIPQIVRLLMIALPYANAIEVTDASGCGAIRYRSWP